MAHFLCYGFHKLFSYKLKRCNDWAREFDRVSGDWHIRVKAAPDLFNLMHKEFIKRIRKRLGEIFERSIVSQILPII